MLRLNIERRVTLEDDGKQEKERWISLLACWRIKNHRK